MNRRTSWGAAGRAAWLDLLLLVPLLWIVLSVFEVQRGAFAVSGAARAAGRAYALAPATRSARHGRRPPPGRYWPIKVWANRRWGWS